MPGDLPEVGGDPSDPAPSRMEEIGSCTCIVLVLACVLFDAPDWIGRALIAWGWV